MQSRIRNRRTKRARQNRKTKSTWHPQTDLETFRRFRDILCRQSTWRWMAIFLMAIWVPRAPAAEIPAADIRPDQMQTGSLLFRMKNGYEVATRMNTAIDARVTGLVARVSVRQEFRNDGADWVEGVYVFPLPDEAAVDHLRMTIGERIIEGEIREKRQAKKEYEQAKAEGKKASLVEQQRANMFTTSVANIAPGESVIVEIQYLETLNYDEGIFSLRFPLTMTPRYIPGHALSDRTGSGWSPDTTQVPDASQITPPMVVRSKDHKVSFSAEINAGVPLAVIASRYHVVDIANNNDRYYVSLGDGDAPMDHDLELTWRPVADSAPRAMLFTEDVGGEQHALLMMLPPDDFSAPVQRMPRELIFVIDTSGSMQGTSIDQAKRALGLALGGLTPNDRFNVIQFNSTTSALFPGSVDASTTNINVARRYVNGLNANGGTEMRSAISRALSSARYESFLRQIVFITDGSVGNEDELFRLIEQQLGDARLFTVGIGSAPNSWFMRKAAEAGRGTFTTISALHEVNEKMERLFRKVEQPQVTDISAQWPGSVAGESYPAIIPDLYAGEPIMVRTRLHDIADTNLPVLIRGTSPVGSWDAEIDWETGDPRSGVGALWARAKIEDLMDQQRRGRSEDETRSDVVAVALQHHLVSKFTSLVAVDKTPVRPANTMLTKEQVPNLVPYGQSTAALIGITSTATNAGIYRMNGVLLMLIGWLLFIYLRFWRSGNVPPKDD
ncbi:MAG: marine proteobacterial sortase target protein [Woeseiaceae bacterium]